MHQISSIVGVLLVNVFICYSTLENGYENLKTEPNIKLLHETFDQKEFDFSGLSKDIRKLMIESSLINPPEVEILKWYAELEYLTFKKCKLTKFDVRVPLAALQIIDLSFNQLAEVKFLEEVNFPSLRTLYLRDNRISSIRRSFFQKHEQLYFIDISNNAIHTIDISIFCEINSIEKIQISMNVDVLDHCDNITIAKDNLPPWRQHDTNVTIAPKTVISTRVPVAAALPNATDICNDFINGSSQHQGRSIILNNNSDDNLLLYIILFLMVTVVILVNTIVILIHCIPRNRKSRTPTTPIPIEESLYYSMPPLESIELDVMSIAGNTEYYDVPDPDYFYSTP